MNERQILNPLGMSMEKRPAVYFPTMTTPELVSYAETYEVTALEKELLCRIKDEMREVESDEYCPTCGGPI